MAIEKTRLLTPEVLQLVAARFQVLADPLRLRLLHELQQGESSVNELTAAVQSTQPNVSKHLKTLQAAGLLARRQEGNTVYYAVADESIFDLCSLVCDSLQQRLQAQAQLLGGITVKAPVPRRAALPLKDRKPQTTV